MANNIAVSITADVADLTAKMALAKVAVTDATKEMMAQAKAANGVMTPGLLAAADAQSHMSASLALVQREAKSASLSVQSIASSATAVAVASGGAVHGIGGIVREFAVLGREGVNGNFTRMAGSATILTQRLAALGPATLVSYAGVASLGAAALAAAGTLAYIAYQAYEAQKAAEGMAEAFALTGRGAGNSVDAIRGNVSALADMADISQKAAQALIAFDATHAQVDERIANAANQLIPQFTKAFGEQGVQELNKFKTELSGVSSGTIDQAVKKFNELNTTMLGFKPAQVQLIEGMIQAGDRIGAVNEILAEFASQGGAHIVSVKDQVVATQKELATAQARAAALAAEVSRPADPRLIGAIQAAARAAAADVAALAGRLKGLQAAAAQSSGESLGAAFASSHATLMSLRDSATRAKDAVHELHQEMDQRRAANPNDKEANDYFAHQAKVDHDLARREDPGDNKKPKTKKPKDDRVAEWNEELRAMQVASGEFFQDETAKELQFWQGKVAAAKGNAATLRAVEAKIYEASKTLARQDYQDHIADFDERIAADKNNWSKQQADIQEKVTYIAGKQGEESREYKRGLQDQETAQRDHSAKVVAEAERAAKEETDTLKHSLDQAQKAREDNAKASEVRLKSNAGASPFGDIKADEQIAAQQQQLNQQKLADNETLHSAETARLAKNVEDAKAKYGEDKDAYAAAIAAKRAEDQRYADAKQTLDAQLRLEQAQSVAQMKSKFESYISGTVSTMASGINKMISGQMTLKSFGVSVYQSIAREAEQQVVKMATTWIAQHVLMAIAAKLTGESQVASAPAGAAATMAASKVAVAALAGQAGAAGIASMAAAPFPMDLGAPAFGAEMAANALAMGSFAQGANVVPNDMIAQIHAGEAIIPKADNDRLINLTERGAGAAGSGSGGGGDHYHTHYSPTVNGQMPFADQLAAHEGHVITMIQRAARRGVRLSG